jgi:hypothetical protein
MSREDDAKIILDNPLFGEVVEELKKQLISEWLNTAPNEVDERESLHLQVHLVDRLYARFESILEDGKMTTHYRI